MAVSDIKFKLTGGANNSDPNASLGGTGSSVLIDSSNSMNNLFDNVSADESKDGDSEYRAIDIHNDGTTDLILVSIYLYSETTSSSTDIQMSLEGIDPISPKTVENESTAPVGQSFAKYNSGSKLSIGDLTAGSKARIWLKRIVNQNCPSLANDTGVIAVEGA